MLRRTTPRQPQPVLSAGGVRIDLRTRTATVADRAVELSAIEYQLLCTLAAGRRAHPRVHPRRADAQHLGLQQRSGAHAGQPRQPPARKLATDTDKLVINVWGVGYRLLPRS